VNGKALLLPKPPYPAEAREKRMSGTVAVKVTIDEQGNVIKEKSICRDDVLGKASEVAAKAAKFAPAIKDGKPTKITGIIIYNFIPPR
jgi:TonB family protein